MLENQKEIFKKETEIRRTEVLKRRTALKLHRITVEHGVNLDRKDINILGFDVEDCIEDWKHEAIKTIPADKFKRFSITGIETRCDEVQFIPPRVREYLAYTFVKQLSAEKKENLLNALKKELKKK